MPMDGGYVVACCGSTDLQHSPLILNPFALLSEFGEQGMKHYVIRVMCQTSKDAMSIRTQI
jgi:hypothetical protein